ncbi:aminopeptidase [Bacillus mesophilus]|uniref:Aminopeptidase n=1 Tax=Bacillus mesophilus TaxID=1808955 RepID=A0A6M0Q832_9BACI|nr:aminopeptidase [Bacillus mesophilus]MBM7662121.1 aminopeptidase [Bacillus mesophilus]NEY72526.1 aminopeptidase [Bacillus mesophilus]
MTTFQEKLDKYAALAVEIGVNVQKGQTLVITAPISAAEFVRKISKKAYEVGAKHVAIDWQDDELTRMKFELAPEEAFTEFPYWMTKGKNELAEDGAAFLHIDSKNPDLLSGIPQERIQNSTKAASSALKPFRNRMMSDKNSWSIVAMPTQAWADKVFPELEEGKRMDALWDAIFQATRIDKENPVEEWKSHTNTLDSKADFLNEHKFHALHYTAPGTDLTVELAKDHIWVSAGSVNENGHSFIANMPTEEVFTANAKMGVNGVVASTKPLSYAGNLIENFSLTFENGKVVNFSAEQGYESLKKLLETDEGSAYLGEVALVPHNSPISNTDLIFFNTLFDENASNHFALGKAYPFCVEGGKNMNEEEVIAHGLNESLSHVDFMVGSAEMNIDGITKDGEKVAVFRNGSWAF